MKMLRKLLWAIACIAVFCITFGISAAAKFLSLMGTGGSADYTLQNKNDGTSPVPNEFEKNIIDISFIKNDGKTDSRPIILYTPKDAQPPLPLVYIPHYAAEEDSADFQAYLAKGWAVASPTNFKNEYNGELTGNDFIFNNAALYTLRHLEQVDDQRIAVVGGSAGGYMALMLGELQMGTCATVANSPIVNAYFNFYIHFQNCDRVNKEAGLFDFPIIVQGMVSKMFRPILENFGEGDYEKWEKLSPLGSVRCISSPVVVNHFTADMLVPVDQISKKYTYADQDECLPEWFSTKMADDYPGILSHSLEEEAEQEELSLRKIDLGGSPLDMEVPYSEKLLSINIFDDGAVRAGNGHSSPEVSGSCDIISFLEEMFKRTLAKTEKAMPKKLRLLLDRYCGNSVQLPAHKDADKHVYGSLAVYRQEVIEELSAYAKNHSFEELEDAVNAAISGSSDENLAAAWEEIKREMGNRVLEELWNNILTAPMAPENYTAEVETGGEIEAKYMAFGNCKIGYFEADYPENGDIKKIEIWYPAEMEKGDKKYPVVLFVNGTGVGASRYKPVFEHLASWGFIAIGNEDPSTWKGEKADATLSWLLDANEDENSVFYQKINLENIGVTGHSQGGVGVYNTINGTIHKKIYKCAVTLSPTQEEVAGQILQIPYDPSETGIPVLMLSGTENDVIAPDDMKKSYAKVISPKVMAVRKNATHGDMLYAADGYVTAWFMWQLQGDGNAAKAFVGENPEIIGNKMYQDQQVDFNVD